MASSTSYRRAKRARFCWRTVAAPRRVIKNGRCCLFARGNRIETKRNEIAAISLTRSAGCTGHDLSLYTTETKKNYRCLPAHISLKLSGRDNSLAIYLYVDNSKHKKKKMYLDDEQDNLVFVYTKPMKKPVK